MARFVTLCLVLCGCVKHVPPGNTELAGRMRAALTSEQPMPVLQGPRALHFLFVGGFLNETIPGYFVDNMAVVRDELGAEVSTLFPPSAGSLDVDAAMIRDEVGRISDSTKRAVVLVGHSKGGAGVVLAVLRYPELITSGRVERVISIQGALHGSPLADGLVASLPMPLVHQAFQGLSTLTRVKAEAAFRASPMRDDLRDWYQDHVFYVRSAETTGQVSTELALSHAFVARYGSGRNDGLLLEEDMRLEGVGTDLGVLRGDHAALVVSSPLSNGTSATRKAFTRALLEQVFAQR